MRARQKAGAGAATAAALLVAPVMAPPVAAAEPGPASSPAETAASVGTNAAVPLPDKPPAEDVDKCKADPESNTEQGRVWNRGLWCQQIGKKFTSGSNQAHFLYTALAYADPADRRVRIFFRVEDYNTQGLAYLPTSNLKLQAGCSSPCSVTGNDDDAKDNWLTNWKGADWVSWDLTSPDAGEGVERVARHGWNLYGNFDGDGLISDGENFDLGSHRIRCDSAGGAPGYGTWTPKACINDDVMPFITYKKSDPAVGQVADHIDTAFNDPKATYPEQGSPKSIPGKYTGDRESKGLHRVPDGSDEHKANVNTKNAIRDRTGEWNGPDDLPPKWERPDPMDADEYPFASTAEGLGRARSEDGIFDGSAQWVNTDQNRTAGTQLQQFYRNDRILFRDQDEFWVNIEP